MRARTQIETERQVMNHQVHQGVIPALMGVTVHSVILMMMGDGYNVTIATLGIIANVLIFLMI